MSNNSHPIETTTLLRESKRQKLNAFLASLKNYKGILNWLISFIRLTEEEQKDAGIYLGDPRYR